MRVCPTRARCVLAALLIACCALPPASVFAEKDAREGIPLEDVIRELEKALADAQAQMLKRGMPRMRSISVTLQTSFRRESLGGGLVVVYTLDMPFDSDRSQEVTLSLSRAPDQTRHETASAATSSPRLVENLLALAEASLAGQDRNVGIRLAELSSTLRLVLKRSGARGTFELVPVSDGPTQELEDRAVHSLTATFSARPNP